MLSGSLLLQNHPQLLYSVLKRVSFSDRKFGIVTFLLYFCADMTQPRQLWSRLTPLYEEGEARAIVMLLLHLDAESHRRLAAAVRDKVLEIRAGRKTA